MKKQEGKESEQQDRQQMVDGSQRSELIAACEQEVERLEDIYESMDGRYNRISVLRLIVFLVLLAGVVLLFLKAWWAAGIVVGAGIAFAWLLIVHSRLEQEQRLTYNRIQVLRQWIAKGRLEWESLPEIGAAYLTEDNYVAKDLDLLGDHSLYQMLCTAHTPEGKRCLADAILHAEKAELEESAIIKRQQAIQELAEHPEFRLLYETLALDQETIAGQASKQRVSVPSGSEQPAAKDKTEDTDLLDSGESGEHHKLATGISVLSFAIPCLLITSVIGAVLHISTPSLILVVYFAGLFLSFLLSGYCNSFLEPVFGSQQLLRSKLALMEAVVAEEFHSELLTGLQSEIMNDTQHSTLQGMKRLERLMAVYHLRHNPIVHFLLGGICLYDVHLAREAVKWSSTYHAQIQSVMGILAELEMLNSFALFACYQDCCYPVIRYDRPAPELHLQNGYHPFLISNQAVKNSMDLDARPRVITGSNMSGKTTFLRTIGINVILAYAGAPVCAEAMELSVMRPFTSMRVTDDVNHGISTFYAEILRIKEMVEYGSRNVPMLCLIDEIFKGTNSADRIVGAEAVIRRLTGPTILPIISTHDFELCDLAENYHFEEFYDEEGIHFDYRLKTGRCQTTNALYLLKLAGLN